MRISTSVFDMSYSTNPQIRTIMHNIGAHMVHPLLQIIYITWANNFYQGLVSNSAFLR